MKSCQLSTRKIAKINKPGHRCDGAGLYLQTAETVTKTGPKLTHSWVFRYQRQGRIREMGLGPYPAVSITLARQLACEQRAHLLRGDDPLALRQEKQAKAKAEVARRVTFKQCCELYLEAHSGKWQNDKHRGQWRATLGTYAYPVLGPLAINEIDLPHILRVLEPIWRSRTETASRLRARIERVLAWAKVRKYRDGDNPAHWRGNLSEVLPSPRELHTVQHLDAIPYSELPDFMLKLRQIDSIDARALEVLTLTALRTGAVTKARWEEFDLTPGAETWTVPGEQMKPRRGQAPKSHIVPLSRRVVEILHGLPREAGSDWVFIGTEKGHLGREHMRLLLQTIRGSKETAHGLRSSFRDWAGERTNYADEVIEFALQHDIPDPSKKEYRRYRATDRRRRLMEDWALYCETPAVEGDNVTSLRRA